VAVAQAYARQHGDTLVIVTADHECSGAALIGSSVLTDAVLRDMGLPGGRHDAADRRGADGRDAARFGRGCRSRPGFTGHQDALATAARPSL
jgi:hypothetical protein